VAGLDPDLRALQEVRDLVERAHAAQRSILGWSQERTDLVCAAMAKAGAGAAYDLAKLAVEETGIGRVHYKVLKNLLGSEGTWESIKTEKTVGIVARDERRGVVEIATPYGVVAGVIPTTNPTSTALFKALIAVKGRNAIVISPHPRAKRCIGESAEVLRRAIERAGGPADLVLSLSNPTIESTGALMRHPKVAVILATGGSGLVNAAYSSGKPAYGVGPGNVPCYVDRSADVAAAARWIVDSQSFDNGTLCCSEQALVIDKPIQARLVAELARRGAHVCSEEEALKLGRACNRGGHMNPDVVGLDPWKVAEMAGFQVPRTTTLLLAYQGGVGKAWPLSIEILAPVLSMHVVDGWEQGCETSLEILRFDGLGHTIGLWAKDQRVIDAWMLEKPANRIVINGPTSEGAVGYSTGLLPSMSLGCGPQAGNITSDNISARHLVNLKRAAFPLKDWEERYARDHARAAAFTGDRAPRGSGFPGDPALAAAAPLPSSSAFAAEPGASWQGNAPVPGSPLFTAPSGGPSSGPAAGARAAAARAVAPGAGATGAVATAPPTASATVGSTIVPRPAAKLAGAAPYVGMALSPREIQGIMAHAGAGCPLGPCKGCPHNDASSGACLA
jgi:acyl-CoA reductase-like NAD-dependent aldehyde dehydrogenase